MVCNKADFEVFNKGLVFILHLSHIVNLEQMIKFCDAKSLRTVCYVTNCAS